MANLVPLHVDKDTGELVATTNPGIVEVGGGGGGSGADGFLHTQSVPSQAWVIVHGQATELLLAQVYTTAGDQIIPDEISIVDINTVEVTLSTPQTGRAHIVFFAQV